MPAAMQIAAAPHTRHVSCRLQQHLKCHITYYMSPMVCFTALLPPSRSITGFRVSPMVWFTSGALLPPSRSITGSTRQLLRISVLRTLMRSSSGLTSRLACCRWRRRSRVRDRLWIGCTTIYRISDISLYRYTTTCLL